MYIFISLFFNATVLQYFHEDTPLNQSDRAVCKRVYSEGVYVLSCLGVVHKLHSSAVSPISL